MKLIFAIINNDDSHAVQSALTKGGIQATKLASLGGFLMAGNTTFMICSEDDKLEEIIEIIRKHSEESSLCPIPQATASAATQAFPLR